MPRAMVKGEGVTYADARTWFAWLSKLGPFTVGELADAMEIEDDLAKRFVSAGTWTIHGGDQRALLQDTGDRANGTYRGEETLFTYVEIEDRNPRNHPHQSPEWLSTPGVGALAPSNRGEPVRIRTDRQHRKMMSGGGSARRVAVAAEDRYKKYMEAVAQRKEAARKRAIKQRDIGNRHKQRQENLPT